MAAGVLFLVGHLPEGAALLLEDGVVPKAVFPPGIKGDGAKALALGLDLVPIGEDAAHRADKVGAPLLRRHALELLQHGQAALAGLGEPGGVNARGPVQVVHAQAGVVGHGGQARLLAGGLRLDKGVFHKGFAGLLRLGKLGGHHFDAHGLQHPLELHHFPLVVGGNDKFHGSFPFLIPRPACGQRARSGAFSSPAGVLPILPEAPPAGTPPAWRRYRRAGSPR